MRIAREEIFGPVLTIIPYEDDADAISIANDTDYGLSALVLGKSAERCMNVARQIDSGRVLINTLAHEPRAPLVDSSIQVLGAKWAGGDERVSGTEDVDQLCPVEITGSGSVWEHWMGNGSQRQLPRWHRLYF